MALYKKIIIVLLVSFLIMLAMIRVKNGWLLPGPNHYITIQNDRVDETYFSGPRVMCSPGVVAINGGVPFQFYKTYQDDGSCYSGITSHEKLINPMAFTVNWLLYAIPLLLVVANPSFKNIRLRQRSNKPKKSPLNPTYASLGMMIVGGVGGFFGTLGVAFIISSVGYSLASYGTIASQPLELLLAALPLAVCLPLLLWLRGQLTASNPTLAHQNTLLIVSPFIVSLAIPVTTTIGDPTDAFGGWVIGWAWVGFVYTIWTVIVIIRAIVRRAR